MVLLLFYLFIQRKSLSPSNGVENGRDGEIRDIASQIMVCDPKFTSRYSYRIAMCPKCISSPSNCLSNSILTPVFVLPCLSVWFQMLDVTVSQLSNLHPALAARVTQKQSELKDCWAVLQKTLR